MGARNSRATRQARNLLRAQNDRALLVAKQAAEVQIISSTINAPHVNGASVPEAVETKGEWRKGKIHHQFDPRRHQYTFVFFPPATDGKFQRAYVSGVMLAQHSWIEPGRKVRFKTAAGTPAPGMDLQVIDIEPASEAETTLWETKVGKVCQSFKLTQQFTYVHLPDTAARILVPGKVLNANRGWIVAGMQVSVKFGWFQPTDREKEKQLRVFEMQPVPAEQN